jgi:hypothetical protein
MPSLVLGPWVLLAALVAGTADPAATIDFDLVRGVGVERCPDHDALAAQVRKRFSQSPARVPVADRVTIAIQRTSDGYLATISALGIEGGTRSLVDGSDDCTGLAEALVLTLSMIADGRPAPVPTQEEASPPPRPSRPWELGAGATGSTGIVGTVSVGATLDLAWHPWPRIAAGISALWLPSRTLDMGPGTTSFTVVAGMARLCGGLLPYGGRLFPAVCGELAAGGLHGSGEGYQDSRSVWVPWLVAGGSLGVGLRVRDWLSLTARAGYMLSLRTEHFTVRNLGPVYDTGHPGFEAGLGALLRIP